MPGMGSIMKQVVNEKGAYIMQQGARKDVTGEELSEMKASATTFDELLMLKKESIVLDGIESVNNSDAYVIKNGKLLFFMM